MNSSLRSQLQRDLRARWGSSWPRQGAFGQLRSAFDKCLDASNSISDENARLHSTGRYSKKGHEDEMRRFAKQHAVPVFWRSSLLLEDARKSLNSQLSRLATPTIDSSDLASALLRSEMRAYLRAMGPAKAIGLLMSNQDARLIASALEVPPEMCGLTADMRNQVCNHLIETKAPSEKAQLDQLREAITITNSALESSLAQMRSDIGFASGEDQQFNSWMQAATQEAEDAEKQNNESLEQKLARLDAVADREIDAIIAKALA